MFVLVNVRVGYIRGASLVQSQYQPVRRPRQRDKVSWYILLDLGGNGLLGGGGDVGWVVDGRAGFCCWVGHGCSIVRLLEML